MGSDLGILLQKKQLHNSKAIIIEISVFLFCFALLMMLLQKSLIFGETTFEHDNSNWNYPMFNFFFEQLYFGHLALWNPFSHGGEPFYPSWGVVRVSDPAVMFFAWLVQIFTNDSVMVYNWSKILQLTMQGFGVYLLFRPVARHLYTRLSLIPILLLSAFVLGSLRQDGFLSQFTWVPFAVLVFLRIIILRRHDFKHFAALGALVGVGWQAYHFVSLHFLLTTLLIGFFIFHRNKVKSMISSGHFYSKLLLFFIIIFSMMLPSLAILRDTKNYIFPARMVEVDFSERKALGGPFQNEGSPVNIAPSSLKMSYEMMKYSGSFGSVTDFIQMIIPQSNYNYKDLQNRYTKYRRYVGSDALLFIGLLPWLLVWIGIFWGRHPLKKIALFTLTLTSLYFFGANTIFLFVVSNVFPPAWFLRHTVLLQASVIFCLLFFFVLGLDCLILRYKDSIKSRLDNLSGALFFKSYAQKAFFLLAAITFAAGWRRIFKGPDIGLGAGGLFFLIILCGICIWYRFGKSYVFALLITSQLLAALKESIFHRYFIFVLAVFLFLPLSFLIYKSWWVKKMTWVPDSRRSQLLLAAVWLIMVSSLVYEFYGMRRVYLTIPRPSIIDESVSSEYILPDFNKMIRTAQNCTFLKRDLNLQAMRYPEFFTHIPTVFSPPNIKPKVKSCPDNAYGISEENDRYEQALSGKRWNSFLLPAKYFEAIHAPSPAVRASFMLGRLPLDFIMAENWNAGNFDWNKTAAFEYSVLSYNYSNLSVRVEAKSAGYLYWADGWDPYWLAQVNGQPAKVELAQNMFKAVYLPSGVSEVNFNYMPRFFLLSMLIFYCVFFGIFGWILVVFGYRYIRSKIIAIR